MYHRTSVKYHSLRYVLWVFVCILHQSSCNLNGSWSNYLSLHQCIVMFLPFEMIWQGEYENVQFALCNDYGLFHLWWRNQKQGKSEGFESCDRPIVRKRSIWVKIGDVLSRVTLKFDGWPWKTIGHLSFAVSSFVQHFIAIGEFKLELQSGNAQFGSNLTIFRAVWPWNLMDDLEKQ